MNLIEVKDKEIFLKANYPFKEIPKMDDKKYCLHCGEIIIVGDFKVERANDLLGKEFDYIVCPNAPKCDGTLIDWMPESWGEPWPEINKLSGMNNDVDISGLKKGAINKILKETKSTLKSTFAMLALPLTEDESDHYNDVVRDCRHDIELIEGYLKIK